MKIRKPAVAGYFYPGSTLQLKATVQELLANAEKGLRSPRMVVCPHAGYSYSGQVQAWAMKQLVDCQAKRIILLGPSHHFAFTGMVGSPAEVWQTPLGESRLAPISGGVTLDEGFHQPEHSLEVQLPFLQSLLPETQITPLLLSGGLEKAEAIAAALQQEQDSLLVISSDFHHVGPRFGYLPKDYGFLSGEEMDQALLELVQAGELAETKLFLKRYHSTVCGALPLLVAMHLLKAWGLGPFRLLAYDCSQNQVGGADSVGYAALAA